MITLTNNEVRITYGFDEDNETFYRVRGKSADVENTWNRLLIHDMIKHKDFNTAMKYFCEEHGLNVEHEH